MSDAKCASCRQQKFKVTPVYSKLKPDQLLLMCDSCIQKKLEPRWIVMMVGRTKGFKAIQHYVRPQRYLGDPIKLEDMF